MLWTHLMKYDPFTDTEGAIQSVGINGPLSVQKAFPKSKNRNALNIHIPQKGINQRMI